MKPKILLLAAATTLAMAWSAQAYTISLNAGSTLINGGVTDHTGAVFSTGSAKFGFFTSDGTLGGMILDNTAISGIGADPAALDAAFVEVGATSDFNANGIAGQFNATVSIASNPDGELATPYLFAEYTAGISGKPVYALFDGQGSVGVFQSNGAAFASGLDQFNNLTAASFLTGDVTSVIGGNDGPPVLTDPVSTVSSLRLEQAIPEPGVSFLVLIGGLVALLRRRK